MMLKVRFKPQTSLRQKIVDKYTYLYTESKCRKVLREQRWGKYVVCPHCGSIRCVERTDGRFHCNDCSANFSELVGTTGEVIPP